MAFVIIEVISEHGLTNRTPLSFTSNLINGYEFN